MIDIGWFSTGRGEGSRGLLRLVQEEIAGGRLEARISFVFSNRAAGEHEGSDEFFRLVEGYGLPLVTLSSARFRRERGGRFAALRDEYDREVMELLGDYPSDVCVLAGYMLILGGEMCRKFPFLNLHPALPDGPIGTWQEVIWELIESRADRTGAMIHLATEEVDRGPVLSYCTVPIAGGEFGPMWAALGEGADKARAEQGENHPLFQAIRAAEYRREPYLLLETLRAVAGGQLLGGMEPPLAPLCLDDAIDRAMGENPPH